MKITLRSNQLRQLIEVPSPQLPTYVAPILNLANRFAGGTRPKVVGQMSEVIQQFNGRSFNDWAEWYQRQYPDGIAKAVHLIRRKLDELKNVMDNINDELIEVWVKDLVLVKTFIGLKFQEAILKAIADKLGVAYATSSPDEEAQGIDGFIGSCPVSIKPVSWKTQVINRETL